MRHYLRLLSAGLLLSTGIRLHAQDEMDGFFKTAEVHFYGLEFSHVRAFGDGFENARDVKYRYFPDMNTFIWENREHYNLDNLFKGKILLYNLKECIDRVELVNPDKLVHYDAMDRHHLNADSVQAIVSQFKKTDTELYGLVVIMEDLNKLDGYGSMWITLFNTKTGEVLFTDRYQDEPAGFGLKRYWLDPVGDCLAKFRKDFSKRFK